MGVRREPGSREFDLSDPARSFAGTVREVFLDPKGFFARLPTFSGLKNPLVFATICLLISSLLESAADYLAGGWTISQNSLLGGALELGGLQGTVLVLFAVLLSPLFALLWLYLFSGFVHLLIVLFVDQKLGFEAILRVVCYASAVTLLDWVPILGFFVTLYGIYVLVVGLRRVHGHDPRVASVPRRG